MMKHETSVKTVNKIRVFKQRNPILLFLFLRCLEDDEINLIIPHDENNTRMVIEVAPFVRFFSLSAVRDFMNEQVFV